MWGDALDELYAVYVAAEEIGSDTQTLADVADPGRRVQLALHARTCLVVAEVHCLLSSGWVFGAMGRARTAHEAAVISSVLAAAESEAPDLELAQRFDDHKVFDLLRDLKRGREEGEDIPEELVTEVEADAAVVASGYEKGFNKTNGWARPLFPGLSPGAWVKLDELLDDVGPLRRSHDGNDVAGLDGSRHAEVLQSAPGESQPVADLDRRELGRLVGHS